MRQCIDCDWIGVLTELVDGSEDPTDKRCPECGCPSFNMLTEQDLSVHNEHSVEKKEK